MTPMMKVLKGYTLEEDMNIIFMITAQMIIVDHQFEEYTVNT